jgi:hypothetical protein
MGRIEKFIFRELDSIGAADAEEDVSFFKDFLRINKHYRMPSIHLRSFQTTVNEVRLRWSQIASLFVSNVQPTGYNARRWMRRVMRARNARPPS